MKPFAGSAWLALLPVCAAAQQAPTPVRPPATFYAGDWGFTLGGNLRLNVVHDFNTIGDADSFDPRNIPVPEVPGSNTRVHARDSRLSLGIAGPAEGRTLTMYVEADFMGSGTTLRMRHAYGQYGVLLAGQTWSTFMDDANIPNTIDNETPVAAPFLRQGQVRLTFPVARQTTVAFGVEEPEPDVVPPVGVTGTVESVVPDLTARFRRTGGRGHFQLSGFVGQARFRPSAGATSTVTIGGLLLSGRLKLARDAAYAEVAWGPGLGRYRGGVSVAPDANNNLVAPRTAALTLGYLRRWSDRWSSNVVFSPAWALDDTGDPTASNDLLVYSAANLLYWFVPDHAWSGCEYLYGRRRVQDGSQADANRLQCAVRWFVPGP